MELGLKIDTTGALKALRAAPQTLVASVRPAVKAGLRDVQVTATQDHAFTSRSGNTDRSVSQEVDASGLSGRVFLDTGISPYGPHLHEGTGLYGPKGQAIEIAAKNKRALRFVFGGGFMYRRKVVVKGIRPDPFLYRSARSHTAGIVARINKAVTTALGKMGLS